ncbi:hypothetical protein [Nakamurella sp.]|uniref:hypothetical protein n=1 Tax=Nakamurella sp. TaxID=1869182 RepID=UPI003B3B1298
MPVVPRRRAAVRSRAEGASSAPSTAMTSPVPPIADAVSVRVSGSSTASAASTSSSMSRPVARTAPECVVTRIWCSAASRWTLIDAARLTAVSRLAPAPVPTWAAAR